jgi:DNA-binding MarR family transcriptional regulator
MSVERKATLSQKIDTASESAAGRRKPVEFGVLEGHLGYAIRRLQVWIFQDFIRKLKQIDLRPAQFSVLVVIGTNPGLSQADVAEALGIERARLVHVLDLLEGRKLIERIRSVTDRRSHALHLTAEGQKFLKRAQALAAEHEADLARKLGTARHAQLLQLLNDAGLSG